MAVNTGKHYKTWRKHLGREQMKNRFQKFLTVFLNSDEVVDNAGF